MIWNYDLEEIIKGYTEDDSKYECVMCQCTFEKGRIYEEGSNLYDAMGAIRNHIRNTHKTVANYLLNQELYTTGLTDIQRRFLNLLLEGKTDQEIGKELGIAQSTVRNHRFKIREREKQAKLFLALMISMEDETKKTIGISDTGTLEDVHNTARMVDDRYNITDKEREKVLATYMDQQTGELKQFPAREKKKIIILSEIVKNFTKDKEYTEGEVNKVLKRIFEEDYPTLRRYLIQYGFMDRSSDCSVYRVKE